MKKIKFCALLAMAIGVFALSSCKKNFESLSKYKVEEFNQFLNPSRSHILLQSNDELYFVQDEMTGMVKLVTANAEKHNLVLSPDALKAAYTDTLGNVRLLNTTGNANDRIIHKLKGVNRIHWTKRGVLYGVTKEGQFKFNGQSLPVPSISIANDTLPVLSEKLHDAVIMPNGKVIYTKHFEVRQGQFTNTGDSLVVWNNVDSTSKTMGTYSDETIPKKLQVNKEGQLIGYTEFPGAEPRAMIYALEPEFTNEIIFSGEFNKLVTSYKSHISAAYIMGNRRKIFVGNKLVEMYPEYAIDDTLVYNQLQIIDDFDIQIPEDQYPQQTFSFD